MILNSRREFISPALNPIYEDIMQDVMYRTISEHGAEVALLNWNILEDICRNASEAEDP